MLLQHSKNKTHSPAASYSKHAWWCLIFKQRKGRNHTNLIYHLVSLYNQMKVANTLKYTPKFLLGFVLLGPWWNVWSPINLKLAFPPPEPSLWEEEVHCWRKLTQPWSRRLETRVALLSVCHCQGCVAPSPGPSWQELLWATGGREDVSDFPLHFPFSPKAQEVRASFQALCRRLWDILMPLK